MLTNNPEICVNHSLSRCIKLRYSIYCSKLIHEDQNTCNASVADTKVKLRAPDIIQKQYHNKFRLSLIKDSMSMPTEIPPSPAHFTKQIVPKNYKNSNCDILKLILKVGY